MPDPIDLTKPMTAAEAAAYLATNPDAINKGLAPLSYWMEKCNVGSAGARSWPVDTSGKAPVVDSVADGLLTTMDADTGLISTNSAATTLYNGVNPYSSDGAALRTTLTSGAMQSYARAYTIAADGSLASTELLPAAGAGLKWVLWDICTSSRASLTGGTGGRAALSDMTSNKGALLEFNIYGVYIHPGPYKQGTANTAVNISAGAGGFTNNSTIFVSFRCATVA